MHVLAQMAEGLGFDSFWRTDHPMVGHDCWTTLAALAAVTRTIRLGTQVSCVAYRSPALLARMAADIDAISHGRLVLGLGSGDMPREFQQLGLAYSTIQERQAALCVDVGEAVIVALGPPGRLGENFPGAVGVPQPHR